MTIESANPMQYASKEDQATVAGIDPIAISVDAIDADITATEKAISDIENKDINQYKEYATDAIDVARDVVDMVGGGSPLAIATRNTLDAVEHLVSDDVPTVADPITTAPAIASAPEPVAPWSDVYRAPDISADWTSVMPPQEFADTTKLVHERTSNLGSKKPVNYTEVTDQDMAAFLDGDGITFNGVSYRSSNTSAPETVNGKSTYLYDFKDATTTAEKIAAKEAFNRHGIEKTTTNIFGVTVSAIPADLKSFIDDLRYGYDIVGITHTVDADGNPATTTASSGNRLMYDDLDLRDKETGAIVKASDVVVASGFVVQAGNPESGQNLKEIDRNNQSAQVNSFAGEKAQEVESTKLAYEYETRADSKSNYKKYISHLVAKGSMPIDVGKASIKNFNNSHKAYLGNTEIKKGNLEDTLKTYTTNGKLDGKRIADEFVRANHEGIRLKWTDEQYNAVKNYYTDKLTGGLKAGINGDADSNKELARVNSILATLGGGEAYYGGDKKAPKRTLINDVNTRTAVAVELDKMTDAQVTALEDTISTVFGGTIGDDETKLDVAAADVAKFTLENNLNSPWDTLQGLVLLDDESNAEATFTELLKDTNTPVGSGLFSIDDDLEDISEKVLQNLDRKKYPDEYKKAMRMITQMENAKVYLNDVWKRSADAQDRLVSRPMAEGMEFFGRKWELITANLNINHDMRVVSKDLSDPTMQKRFVDVSGDGYKLSKNPSDLPMGTKAVNYKGVLVAQDGLGAHIAKEREGYDQAFEDGMLTRTRAFRNKYGKAILEPEGMLDTIILNGVNYATMVINNDKAQKYAQMLNEKGQIAGGSPSAFLGEIATGIGSGLLAYKAAAKMAQKANISILQNRAKAIAAGGVFTTPAYQHGAKTVFALSTAADIGSTVVSGGWAVDPKSKVNPNIVNMFYTDEGGWDLNFSAINDRAKETEAGAAFMGVLVSASMQGAISYSSHLYNKGKAVNDDGINEYISKVITDAEIASFIARDTAREFDAVMTKIDFDIGKLDDLGKLENTIENMPSSRADLLLDFATAQAVKWNKHTIAGKIGIDAYNILEGRINQKLLETSNAYKDKYGVAFDSPIPKQGEGVPVVAMPKEDFLKLSDADKTKYLEDTGTVQVIDDISTDLDAKLTAEKEAYSAPTETVYLEGKENPKVTASQKDLDTAEIASNKATIADLDKKITDGSGRVDTAYKDIRAKAIAKYKTARKALGLPASKAFGDTQLKKDTANTQKRIDTLEKELATDPLTPKARTTKEAKLAKNKEILVTQGKLLAVYESKGKPSTEVEARVAEKTELEARTAELEAKQARLSDDPVTPKSIVPPMEVEAEVTAKNTYYDDSKGDSPAMKDEAKISNTREEMDAIKDDIKDINQKSDSTYNADKERETAASLDDDTLKTAYYKDKEDGTNESKLDDAKLDEAQAIIDKANANRIDGEVRNIDKPALINAAKIAEGIKTKRRALDENYDKNVANTPATKKAEIDELNVKYNDGFTVIDDIHNKQASIHKQDTRPLTPTNKADDTVGGRRALGEQTIIKAKSDNARIDTALSDATLTKDRRESLERTREANKQKIQDELDRREASGENDAIYKAYLDRVANNQPEKPVPEGTPVDVEATINGNTPVVAGQLTPVQAAEESLLKSSKTTEDKSIHEELDDGAPREDNEIVPTVTKIENEVLNVESNKQPDGLTRPVEVTETIVEAPTKTVETETATTPTGTMDTPETDAPTSNIADSEVTPTPATSTVDIEPTPTGTVDVKPTVIETPVVDTSPITKGIEEEAPVKQLEPKKIIFDNDTVAGAVALVDKVKATIMKGINKVQKLEEDWYAGHIEDFNLDVVKKSSYDLIVLSTDYDAANTILNKMFTILPDGAGAIQKGLTLPNAGKDVSLGPTSAKYKLVDIFEDGKVVGHGIKLYRNQAIAGQVYYDAAVGHLVSSANRQADAFYLALNSDARVLKYMQDTGYMLESGIMRGLAYATEDAADGRYRAGDILLKNKDGVENNAYTIIKEAFAETDHAKDSALATNNYIKSLFGMEKFTYSKENGNDIHSWNPLFNRHEPIEGSTSAAKIDEALDLLDRQRELNSLDPEANFKDMEVKTELATRVLEHLNSMHDWLELKYHDGKPHMFSKFNNKQNSAGYELASSPMTPFDALMNFDNSINNMTDAVRWYYQEEGGTWKVPETAIVRPPETKAQSPMINMFQPAVGSKLEDIVNFFSSRKLIEGFTDSGGKSFESFFNDLLTNSSDVVKIGKTNDIEVLAYYEKNKISSVRTSQKIGSSGRSLSATGKSTKLPSITKNYEVDKTADLTIIAENIFDAVAWLQYKQTIGEGVDLSSNIQIIDLKTTPNDTSIKATKDAIDANEGTRVVYAKDAVSDGLQYKQTADSMKKLIDALNAYKLEVEDAGAANVQNAKDWNEVVAQPDQIKGGEQFTHINTVLNYINKKMVKTGNDVENRSNMAKLSTLLRTAVTEIGLTTSMFKDGGGTYAGKKGEEGTFFNVTTGRIHLGADPTFKAIVHEVMHAIEEGTLFRKTTEAEPTPTPKTEGRQSFDDIVKGATKSKEGTDKPAEGTIEQLLNDFHDKESMPPAVKEAYDKSRDLYRKRYEKDNPSDKSLTDAENQIIKVSAMKEIFVDMYANKALGEELASWGISNGKWYEIDSNAGSSIPKDSVYMRVLATISDFISSILKGDTKLYNDSVMNRIIQDVDQKLYGTKGDDFVSAKNKVDAVKGSEGSKFLYHANETHRQEADTNAENITLQHGLDRAMTNALLTAKAVTGKVTDALINAPLNKVGEATNIDSIKSVQAIGYFLRDKAYNNYVGNKVLELGSKLDDITTGSKEENVVLNELGNQTAQIKKQANSIATAMYNALKTDYTTLSAKGNKHLNALFQYGINGLKTADIPVVMRALASNDKTVLEARQKQSAAELGEVINLVSTTNGVPAAKAFVADYKKLYAWMVRDRFEDTTPDNAYVLINRHFQNLPSDVEKGLIQLVDTDLTNNILVQTSDKLYKSMKGADTDLYTRFFTTYKKAATNSDHIGRKGELLSGLLWERDVVAVKKSEFDAIPTKERIRRYGMYKQIDGDDGWLYLHAMSSKLRTQDGDLSGSLTNHNTDAMLEISAVELATLNSEYKKGTLTQYIEENYSSTQDVANSANPTKDRRNIHASWNDDKSRITGLAKIVPREKLRDAETSTLDMMTNSVREKSYKGMSTALNNKFLHDYGIVSNKFKNVAEEDAYLTKLKDSIDSEVTEIPIDLIFISERSFEFDTVKANELFTTYAFKDKYRRIDKLRDVLPAEFKNETYVRADMYDQLLSQSLDFGANWLHSDSNSVKEVRRALNLAAASISAFKTAVTVALPKARLNEAMGNTLILARHMGVDSWQAAKGLTTAIKTITTYNNLKGDLIEARLKGEDTTAIETKIMELDAKTGIIEHDNIDLMSGIVDGVNTDKSTQGNLLYRIASDLAKSSVDYSVKGKSVNDGLEAIGMKNGTMTIRGKEVSIPNEMFFADGSRTKAIGTYLMRLTDAAPRIVLFDYMRKQMMADGQSKVSATKDALDLTMQVFVDPKQNVNKYIASADAYALPFASFGSKWLVGGAIGARRNPIRAAIISYIIYEYAHDENKNDLFKDSSIDPVFANMASLGNDLNPFTPLDMKVPNIFATGASLGNILETATTPN